MYVISKNRLNERERICGYQPHPFSSISIFTTQQLAYLCRSAGTPSEPAASSRAVCHAKDTWLDDDLVSLAASFLSYFPPIPGVPKPLRAESIPRVPLPLSFANVFTYLSHAPHKEQIYCNY